MPTKEELHDMHLPPNMEALDSNYIGLKKKDDSIYPVFIKVKNKSSCGFCWYWSDEKDDMLKMYIEK